MTDLNDNLKRQELVSRYLNAETTIEEEQLLLEYYTHAKDLLSPEEEDVRLVILSTSQHAGDMELSEEKEAEFDRMMEDGKEGVRRHSRPKSSFALWSAFLAAAVILAFVVIHRMTKEAPQSQQVAMVKKTTPPSANQEEMAMKPQEEKEATNQSAKAEDGTASPQATLLAEERNEPKTSTPIMEEDAPEAPMSEVTHTEKHAEIAAKARLDDTEESLCPVNVTTANYTEERQRDVEFYPSGNAAFVTVIASNVNGMKHIASAFGNNMITRYLELCDDTVIYIIDGERASLETVIQLPYDCIQEMRMLKRGSAAAIRESYEGLTKDIMVIKTQKSKSQGHDHSSVPLRSRPLVTDNNMRNGINYL